MEIEKLFTRNKNSADAFICRCTDEGAQEADALMEEVKRMLLTKGNVISVNEKNLLSHVVYELNWEHNAYIDNIGCDQWALVTAKTYYDKDPYTVSVQCDDVEDGVAAVYYAMATRKPV